MEPSIPINGVGWIPLDVMFTFKFPAALGILIACHDQILVYALAGGASKGGCISVTGLTLDPIGSKEKGLGLNPGL